MTQSPEEGRAVVASAEGLAFTWATDPILCDIDLTVQAGEVVALTGPSGAGKSTLLRCLAGLLLPDRGTIRFEGEPLPRSARGRARLRLERMGFVFQSGELVPELTLIENVELPLRSLGVPRRSARARAVERLDELGLGGVGTQQARAVSGGQRQRAAVARALVHRPRLVLADEPTGSVDETNAALVVEALEQSARQQQAAVLLVTHDLGIARRADRCLDLRRHAGVSARPEAASPGRT